VSPVNSIDLSIIIPALDEAQRLPKTLASLVNWLEAQALRWEVIVCDDGSTDGTLEALASIGEIAPGGEVRSIRSAQNRGKGHAVRSGMLAARGAIRVMCDADNSMPASELTHLLLPIRAGTASVAIGSRYLNGGHSQGQPRWRRAWSRACNIVNQALLVPGIADTHCGYKAFTARAAEEIFGRATIDGWAFDLEVLALAPKLGHRVLEVSVEWKDDVRSRVRPWRDLSRTVTEAARIRCNLDRGRYQLGSGDRR
jgi:dolichyl-phosphate beta-glucosyltransferase